MNFIQLEWGHFSEVKGFGVHVLNDWDHGAELFLKEGLSLWNSWACLSQSSSFFFTDSEPVIA